MSTSPIFLTPNELAALTLADRWYTDRHPERRQPPP
jgi:hypothetical protein